MRGQRKPRKIDIIKEQSKIIWELQEAYKKQGIIVLALMDEIKRLNSSN